MRKSKALQLTILALLPVLLVACAGTQPTPARVIFNVLENSKDTYNTLGLVVAEFEKLGKTTPEFEQEFIRVGDKFNASWDLAAQALASYISYKTQTSDQSSTELLTKEQQFYIAQKEMLGLLDEIAGLVQTILPKEESNVN